MRAIITILDSTTETSMPFNEFALYRAKHYTNERQILIICNQKRELPNVEIPGRMEIIYAGRKIRKIRRTITETIAKLNEQGVPYIIHMHQVQSGFLAQFAMLGTGFSKKVIFTVHSTFSGYKLHNKLLSLVNTFFARQITCVSETSYHDYPNFIKRIKGKRIQALQNGVDTERIDRVLATSIETSQRTGTNFIYVARLIPIKNHEFLVDVLANADSKIHFIFVGAEDAGKKVRRRAERLGVADRITFKGLISRDEVFKQLKNADYYISSSTLEGLPVSVLEAMYCGLPCILSDIPQHRESAENEAIILRYDIDSWVTEINRLAKLNMEERVKMRRSIKEYVTDNFTIEKMHKRYDVIYSTF